MIRLRSHMGLFTHRAPSTAATRRMAAITRSKYASLVAVDQARSSRSPRSRSTPSGTSRPMPSSGSEPTESESVPISSEISLDRLGSGVRVTMAWQRSSTNCASRRVSPGTSAASTSQSTKAGYPPSSR